MTDLDPTPFPYEDPEHQLPPHTTPTDRPPIRRPDTDPYSDAAARITCAAWLTFAVAGLMGAIVDHTHAGYWLGAAFTLCILTAIAAKVTATALKAVK